MNYLLISSFITSFIVTLFLTPYWIRAATKAGLVGKDMNKYRKPAVAEIGGIPIVAGFMAGLLVYIAFSTFYLDQDSFLIYVLACASTILSMTIIGIVDDVLRWKIGLKQWQKPLLTLPAALPIMAVNAGHSTMSVPFIGYVDFGLLYPLLIIPIGIVGAANGFNMLAGYNGFEAGMGVVILSTLGLVSWNSGNTWITMIAFTMVFSLMAFLVYNKYPARVFPGDTMTYSVGALIASVAIFGNMEKIALILFIPYYLDFLLPLRKKLKVEAFGKAEKDGSLSMPYDGIYDMGHFAIYVLARVKEKVYEKEVTLLLILIELFISILILIAL